MTVMNTSYSTLEEAWGGDIAGRPTRKNDQNRKKKPPTDPICDLYASKVSSSSYNETDLVKFANEYFDKFEKSKYQRNMKTQPLSYEEVEREPSPKNLTISKGESRYDLTKKKQPEEYPLFQKQFEMKLPPLYDGGECPDIPQEEQASIYSESNAVPGYVYAEWEDKPVCRPRRRIGQEYHTGQEDTRQEYHQEINQEFDETLPEEYRRRLRIESELPYCEDEDYSGKVYDEGYNTQGKYYNRSDKNYKYNGPKVREDYDDFDDFYPKKRFSNMQVFDLMLYVISGIILIFLLEQFVRIGINLSH